MAGRLLLAAVLGATASLGPAPAASGLTCRYTVTQWPGGFSADLRITNLGSTAVNGWTAFWTFRTATLVTNTWSGTITQHSPYDATGRNAAYNGVIHPGSSTALGWTATAATTEIPDEIIVNGSRCPTG